MPCSRCAFVMGGSIPDVGGSMKVARIAPRADDSIAGDTATPSRGPEFSWQKKRPPPALETTTRDGRFALCRRSARAALADRPLHVLETANIPPEPSMR